MPTIDVDEQTYANIQFAARMSGRTPGEIVMSAVASLSTGEASPADDGHVRLFAIYQKHRVEALFDPATKTVTITSDITADREHRSPSAAAAAVVSALTPGASNSRNGWTFWRITTTGKELSSLR